MDLSRAALEAADPTRQFAEVLDMPVHLRDALWRMDSAGAAPLDAPLGLIVAGMGGSAIGGRLARGALGGRLLRPLLVGPAYALPAWAGPETLVLCSSYSGDTEEAVAAYDDAAARGAPRIVATTGGALAARARADGVPVVPLPGGFQPRAAVGYSVVAALEAAALCGTGPSLREEIEAAAALVERLAAEWGPDGPEDGEAKTLARRLDGSAPIVVGGELAAAGAYRWKCQFNENAKLPSWTVELPEGAHNEIQGWLAAGEMGEFACVVLEDPGSHPRNVLRTRFTADLAARDFGTVLRATARGESRLERLLSLVLLGDLVSLYLAALRGVDPADVGALDALKARMAAVPSSG
jgi:glucose/mannose-6-phosphate isomerase